MFNPNIMKQAGMLDEGSQNSIAVQKQKPALAVTPHLVQPSPQRKGVTQEADQPARLHV